MPSILTKKSLRARIIRLARQNRMNWQELFVAFLLGSVRYQGMIYFFHFSRRLLVTTLTLLRAMAAPAIIGLSKNPFTG